MDNEAKKNNSETKRTLTANGKVIAIETEEEKKTRISTAKAKLNEQLAQGIIDGATYNQELIKLEVPEEYKPKPHRPIKITALIATLIIMLIASIPAIIYVNWRFYFQNNLNTNSVNDYYDSYAASIDNEPIQIAVDGSDNGEYKGRKIQITYKDYYDISGIVTSVHDYWGFDDYATLVPRDVCMAWGDLAKVYLAGDASFYQNNRSCYGKASNDDLDPSETFSYRTSFGQIRTSISSMSNNHLIPSTPEIRSQIFGLRAGEKVRIAGYLVNVHYGDIQLDSSTTREDSGNGACEIIYVTHVNKINT